MPKKSVCTAYAPFSDSLKPRRAGTPAIVKVMGMATEANANLIMKGPLLPNDHPNLPALHIISKYLETTLNIRIRDQGLAYGVFSYISFPSLHTFEVHKSSDVLQVSMGLRRKTGVLPKFSLNWIMNETKICLFSRFLFQSFFKCTLESFKPAWQISLSPNSYLSCCHLGLMVKLLLFKSLAVRIYIQPLLKVTGLNPRSTQPF